MTAAAEVLYEVRGEVAVITLNRPDQLNAINNAMCEQLTAAFRRFDEDRALRVAILTAAGDRSFSAGRDLKEVAGGAQRPPIPVIGATVEVNKPVIAAVNGTAVGGGWIFAQMCDLCIAAEHATFGIAEAKVGRGLHWTPPLVHMVGSRIALELMITGKTIDAQRAHAIGFVNRVVPYSALLPAAYALAEEIIACAPLSVANARRMVREAMNNGVDAALAEGETLAAQLYASEDASEGPRAFKEKRKPVWKGR
ncbi:MAG: enoyl-CoA hydratase/isomerase family protein [Rhodocyclales bacterium]|nr:enoyl-CoA hydratase/isomerase family protein [Rhodocyclales bacterium]